MPLATAWPVVLASQCVPLSNNVAITSSENSRLKCHVFECRVHIINTAMIGPKSLTKFIRRYNTKFRELIKVGIVRPLQIAIPFTHTMNLQVGIWRVTQMGI